MLHARVVANTGYKHLVCQSQVAGQTSNMPDTGGVSLAQSGVIGTPRAPYTSNQYDHILTTLPDHTPHHTPAQMAEIVAICQLPSLVTVPQCPAHLFICFVLMLIITDGTQ